jgi:hypothetical protein
MYTEWKKGGERTE